MAERVTAERVETNEHHVRRHDQCPEANPERRLTRAGSHWKARRQDDVVGKEPDEDEREVKEVAVNVLDDERKLLLAPVTRARLTNRTGRWIGPERFVVAAPVVVTGEAKST